MSQKLPMKALLTLWETNWKSASLLYAEWTSP